MSDYLDEGILTEILARLPVKSLLRFRSVSRCWYSLISSSTFINTHLNLHKQDKKNNFLLFKHCYFKDGPSSQAVPYYSFNHQDTIEECPGYLRDLSYVAENSSCNGLFCLCWGGFLGSIVLWNPAINRYVMLPKSNITPQFKHGEPGSVTGFGFDPRANDYKVVRLVYLDDVLHRFRRPVVELFELSKRSWRGVSCNNAPPYYYFPRQAYVNGAVHWIALDDPHNSCRSLIVAFDMVNEVFSEITYPDSCRILPEDHLIIDKHEESLVVYHYHLLTDFFWCDVWVMKEYGIVDSWVKQFNIALRGEIHDVQSLIHNGDQLILSKPNGKLALFNTKDQQTIDVEGCPNALLRYMGTHMESLVLLDERRENSWDSLAFKELNNIRGKEKKTIRKPGKI
ncbi:F-box domain-containing protein/FBA_1 domain-containing protein [Cephalotus follicularis]|uniref:F-box domain-containing protein/FBA_1 domain-containing protein n=1 Tax=Cephalotus follicularis TaxID=3775 RepID=A0A1Q3DF94_CEPFO|nr:F-box domain-containing protein/FBA_1 domain-containing protein [Cephalotus follicularis]